MTSRRKAMPRGPTGRSLDHVGAARKAQGAVVTAYSANKTVLRMPGEAPTTAPRQSSSVCTNLSTFRRLHRTGHRGGPGARALDRDQGSHTGQGSRPEL